MSDKRPFHNPFAVLGQFRGAGAPDSGAGAEDAGATPLADNAPADGAARAPSHTDTRPSAAGRSTPTRWPRAVVRIERSGRGGKEVTVIEQLALTADERTAWLKALKGQLGCGGSVEDDALMLQGDQRKRLPPLLAARGVKMITVA
jgi:translation initiation factor 1